mgnify:CR=1 FL=1
MAPRRNRALEETSALLPTITSISAPFASTAAAPPVPTSAQTFVADLASVAEAVEKQAVPGDGVADDDSMTDMEYLARRTKRRLEEEPAADGVGVAAKGWVQDDAEAGVRAVSFRSCVRAHASSPRRCRRLSKQPPSSKHRRARTNSFSTRRGSSSATLPSPSARRNCALSSSLLATSSRFVQNVPLLPRQLTCASLDPRPRRRDVKKGKGPCLHHLRLGVVRCSSFRRSRSTLLPGSTSPHPPRHREKVRRCRQGLPHSDSQRRSARDAQAGGRQGHQLGDFVHERA